MPLRSGGKEVNTGLGPGCEGSEMPVNLAWSYFEKWLVQRWLEVVGGFQMREWQ